MSAESCVGGFCDCLSSNLRNGRCETLYQHSIECVKLPICHCAGAKSSEQQTIQPASLMFLPLECKFYSSATDETLACDQSH
jgi:hypothetical protein